MMMVMRMVAVVAVRTWRVWSRHHLWLSLVFLLIALAVRVPTLQNLASLHPHRPMTARRTSIAIVHRCRRRLTSSSLT